MRREKGQHEPRFDVGLAFQHIEIVDAAVICCRGIPAAFRLRGTPTNSPCPFEDLTGVVADAPSERMVLHASGMLDRQAQTEGNAAMRHRAGHAVAAMLMLVLLCATGVAPQMGLNARV